MNLLGMTAVRHRVLLTNPQMPLQLLDRPSIKCAEFCFASHLVVALIKNKDQVSNTTSATSPSSQATIVDDTNIVFVWSNNVEEAFREIGQIVQTV
jgi:hypothetical protein